MEGIHNNNNVYILGAGFSAPYGMPLVKDFMVRMREAADWLDSSGNKVQKRAMEEVFKFRNAAASAAYRINMNIDDVEQLFSLAAAVDQSALSDAMKECIAATIEFCRSQHRLEPANLSMEKDALSRFPMDVCARRSEFQGYQRDGLTFESITMRPYDYYVGTMLGRFHPEVAAATNTIITFNYDLVIEESLARLQIPFHYGIPSATLFNGCNVTKSTGLPLLKLHGSVNWGYPGTRGRRLTVFPDYATCVANAKWKLIIPPTWQKVFDDYFAQIWNQAVKAVENATRIIVVGFSLPDTDIHFKYLLAAGLRQNISLREITFVNPVIEASFAGKIQSFFTEGQISTGVVKHLSVEAQSFFEQAGYMKLLNRPRSYLG